MRAPLGFLFSSIRMSTHATLWPYLPRFMPRPLISIGLGDPLAAELYRPGDEVMVAVADCEGLRELAGPGRWSTAAVSVVTSSIDRHMRSLGNHLYGAYHRAAGGRSPARGFDRWSTSRLEVTLDLAPDSPVRATSDVLTVRLPATMTKEHFSDVLGEFLDVVALDSIVTTAIGRRRCFDLGLQPGAYMRETALDSHDGTIKVRAEDLIFFRPHLDADALVALIETLITAHLLDLRSDGGIPF